MRRKYKALSMLLALIIACPMLPPSVLADDEADLNEAQVEEGEIFTPSPSPEIILPEEEIKPDINDAEEDFKSGDEKTDEKTDEETESDSKNTDEVSESEVEDFIESVKQNSVAIQAGSARKNSTYDYILKGDPFDESFIIDKTTDTTVGNVVVKEAYDMSDASFFGVWDKSKNKWTKKSKLDFDNYDLDAVESAVKEGDYEQAKFELYNYYVRRQRGWNLEKKTSTTKKDRMTADLLCKNFMYNANSGITPLELLYVDNDAKYVQADITSTIEKYKGTRQYISFFILATDKDGENAEFWSHEAGEDTQAYLQMKVDGADITIPVSEDTYISGGANSAQNYGSEDRLYAQEDAIGTEVLINEQTKRIYMKFDISSIRSTDNISAATFNIYGKTSKESGEKELVLFYADESTWTESSATLNAVIAQVIYSYDRDDTWTWEKPTGAGFRYPEELLRFNTWFDKLVKLYNVTGDEKYSYTALRQLMDFINVKGNKPIHDKTLDVALRTQTLPPYIMQLLESEYMSPEIFTAVMKYCYVEANAEQYFARTGNWGMSEACGLYTVSVYFPEFADSEQWLTAVKTRNDYLSGLVVRDDCTSTELSIGYVDYTIDCLTALRKVATELGISSGYYGDQTVENIHKLGLGMFYTSLPGIKDNQVGDGYSHRGNFSSRMTYLSDWFSDDEELKFAATDGAKGKKPDFTSKYFPNGRKVVMRTSWDENAMYLFTDADGGVGNHSHPDDNAIVAYAYGQYLLVDPLYGTYSPSPEKTWLTSTKAHNVVTVNGKNQSYNSSSAVGKITKFETNNSYDFSTTDSPATPGISSYKRSVFFLRNKFWLVNDYLTPSGTSANEYKQTWHFLPEAGIELDDSTKIVKTNLTKANIQVVPVEASEADAAIVTGYYSEGQGSVSNAKYLEYTKAKSGNTVFNTLLLPENTGKDYDVTATPLTPDSMDTTDISSYDVNILDKSANTNEHYQYYLLHNQSLKSDITTDSHTSDASMLFVQLADDSSTLYTAAQDVKYVTNNVTGKTIINSDSKLADIAYSISGNYAAIDGSALTAENVKSNNLSLYAGDADVKAVILNGEEVNYTLKNGYIYLGTVKDNTPSVTPTPTPKPSQEPSHSSSGGSSSGGGGYYVSGNTPSPSPAPSLEPSGMSSEMAEEISGHWAENEIRELYNDGIISGISETSFGLKNNVTRAEFASMLVRLLGLDNTEYGSEFSDVTQNDWYSGYVSAAYKAGIIKGYGETFDPNGLITREQMCTMLKNAAAYIGKDTSDIAELAFSDSASISGWAADSVGYASKAGLIYGLDDGSFAPKNNAKREEAFAVICRLKHLQ